MNGSIFKFILTIAVICYIALFHSIRGEKIEASTEDNLNTILDRLQTETTSIRSQSEFNDIGQLAWIVVNQNGITPGTFYLKYIEKLDNLERFHHLIHQPFTGYQFLYTDIWINSATVYGTNETSWGRGTVTVDKANSLAMFLLIVDRLQRGYNQIQEHLQCYLEIFTGMNYYTLSGKETVYKRVLSYATRNKSFRSWFLKELQQRPKYTIDQSEWDYWNQLSSNYNMKPINSTVDTIHEIIQIANQYFMLKSNNQI